MQLIKFDDKIETIYNVDDFPYKYYRNLNYMCYRKNVGRYKKNPYYIELVNAFDIETTSYKPLEIGFMYLWGCCIGNKHVIMGRTWEEFQTFIYRIHKTFDTSLNKRLVIYVHFLPFEFQFMHNFLDIEEVFAREKRVPIKVTTVTGIEFRCSYALTNMSLDKFCRNSRKCEYQKRSGEKFDYSKIRTASTQLSDEELAYQYCDVRGLCESITDKLELESDNLSIIPITSTGYVRRDYRNVVTSNEDNFKKFQEIKLRPFLYALCKSATRGGNCHCNPLYSDVLLRDVTSYDKKSSYPFTMAVEKFPMTKFLRALPNECEELVKNYACLIDISFYDITIIDVCTIPYIAKAKCTSIQGARIDNGRVIKASSVSMVITDLDLKIIKKQYNYKDYEIRYLYVSEYGYLNYEFRRHLVDMFQIKTELESGDKYLYNKYKNKINSSFGMMLTDIAQEQILYVKGNTMWECGDINVEQMLNRYYRSRNNFLSYQHGVWVTSHARYNLQKAIDITGSDTVYVDTDSDKFISDYDDEFVKLNEEIIAECESVPDCKAYAEVDGKRTYLGVWELDGRYDYFKSLGAKKYAYIKNGKKEVEITVAGLSKQKGADYINENGGMSIFCNGTVIPKGDSGRTTSKYNDDTDIYTITIDDCTFTTSSNIYIENTEYTFGQTEEYQDFIKEVQKY